LLCLIIVCVRCGRDTSLVYGVFLKLSYKAGMGLRAPWLIHPGRECQQETNYYPHTLTFGDKNYHYSGNCISAFNLPEALYVLVLMTSIIGGVALMPNLILRFEVHGEDRA